MGQLDKQQLRTSVTGSWLNEVYLELSQGLEHIQDELFFARPDQNQQICLAVIEDDLINLLSECEGFILGAVPAKRTDIESFHSRALCVFEELQRIDSVMSQTTPSTH